MRVSGKAAWRAAVVRMRIVVLFVDAETGMANAGRRLQCSSDSNNGREENARGRWHQSHPAHVA